MQVMRENVRQQLYDSIEEANRINKFTSVQQLSLEVHIL